MGFFVHVCFSRWWELQLQERASLALPHPNRPPSLMTKSRDSSEPWEWTNTRTYTHVCSKAGRQNNIYIYMLVHTHTNIERQIALQTLGAEHLIYLCENNIYSDIGMVQAWSWIKNRCLDYRATHTPDKHLSRKGLQFVCDLGIIMIYYWIWTSHVIYHHSASTLNQRLISQKVLKGKKKKNPPYSKWRWNL